MYLLKCLSLFFLLACHLVSAQSYSHEWVKGIGGSGDDRGLSIAVDSQGNVYTTGYFYNTVDFDPGPNTAFLTSLGNNDAFVQKLDANGNFLWVKQIGGTFIQLATGIAIDSADNVYIGGTFSGTADFDPGIDTVFLTASGSNVDPFVEKLTSDGNFLWAKKFGGEYNDQLLTIGVDPLGNVCSTGFFSVVADFDPSSNNAMLSSQGERDVFIHKMDTDGNFLWAKGIGGTYSDWGVSLAIDDLGNIFTTGVFVDSIDIDPGTGVTNLIADAMSADIFILKLSPNGIFHWARKTGGVSVDISSAIDLDSSGNVFISGQFSSTVDFDPGAGVYNLSSFQDEDFFIQKLDGNGNFIWSKSIVGVYELPYGTMRVDASGNVFSTGYFQGTVDFNPGIGVNTLTSWISVDAFTLHLDSAGNFVWVKHTKGTAMTKPSSICIDQSGSIYTLGSYGYVCDFNSGGGTDSPSSFDLEDVYIHKLSPCTPLAVMPMGMDVITACDSLLWIDGNTYYSDNNTATFTILGGSEDGCGDSLAILNLTIINSSNGVDTRQECPPFTWIDGNSYTTDNNTATFALVGAAANGCDSIITLDLTILNPGTGVDTQIGCNAYTWIDGNTYTADNNTATYSIVGGAANGCDSIVTLDLTMNYINTNTTLYLSLITSNAVGAYQWLDCNNAYSAIPEETNQSFTGIVSGSYAVEVSQNGCVDTSDCVTILTNDILENTLNDRFTLTPNPTIGKFTIEFDTVQENLAIRIVSISGQVLENYRFDGASIMEMELNQPNGVYLLEINDSKGKRAVLRIVKQ